jgi:hypothetical protein
MKSRKGVELSINVIIIALIALVVLVVLFAIFTGRMGFFSNYLSGPCSKRNGVCKTSCDLTTQTVFVGASDCTTGQVCCITNS